MSAASAPLYNKFTITKGKGEPVGFAKKVVSFEYFESLYSPTVTANIAILEAGNSTKEKLNLSGNEKIEFIVEHSSGTLKFDRKNALRVNGAPTVLRESNRESVLLPLVSNYEIQNKGTPVFDKYANQKVNLKHVNESSVLDFIETQDSLIYQVKKQCALIEVKSTARGTQTFDLPLHLKKDGSQHRARRDNYTTLMLATWATKCYFDMQEVSVEANIGFSPRMIG